MRAGSASAIAPIAARRDFFEHMVLADVDLARAERAVARADGGRFAAATRRRLRPRARSPTLAREVARRRVVNACDPRLNPPIFDGAFAAGCTYLDMAMHLSQPHPERPYEETGVKLGDAQFAVADEWASTASSRSSGSASSPDSRTCSPGTPPTISSTTSTRSGSATGPNLVIDGYDFAPTFSIWTTIEECLNPPVIWERDRGWFTTAPFSEPEVFEFPGGIGPVECVNVEHEEVLLVPRWVDCNRVTFKYGLGDEFIAVLEALHKTGLDRTEKIRVRDVDVAPRDVVAAALPNPAELGDRMHGKTCAGTWVTGTGTDGTPRAVYLHHIVDNDWSMAEYGHQAVVWQTAINPVIGLELLARGDWSGRGRARARGVRRACRSSTS